MTLQSSGIRVRIIGDDSDLKSKLDDSRKALDKWAKLAVAGAAAAGAAIVKSTAESSREIANLSRLVGESTTEFQRNAAAAKTLGIEQEKYADIMKDVQDKVGDFIQTGAGPMADFFENIAPKVGVTADQFKKLNGRDALQLYVDSLEKANVSQNEMTFFMEAIASDASMLIPLLKDSGEQFDALGDRAEEAGAVMSSIDLAKMEAMQRSFDESRELLTGLTNQIALQLAPILQGIGDLFESSGDKAEGMRKAVEKAFEFTIKGSGIVADGIRGVHVVIKGIEAAFWGLSAVTAEIFEQMARGVDDFVVKPILSSINALIDGINKVKPGKDLERIVIGDSDVVRALTEISDAATAKMKETAGELHDLLMEPLPSTALENFVKLAQEKSEEAAKAIAETRDNVGLAIPEIPDPGQDPEVVAEQNKVDAMLAAYQAYGQARIDSQEDFNATEEEKAKAFADKMKAIDEQRFNNQLAGASSFFGDLSSLMNTESRTLFAIGKAAAIAQAVVDGIAAAVSSFKFGAAIGGPVLGGAFAAASAAATGVQIAALAATSFGSASSGGATGASPSVAAPSVDQSVGGQQGNASGSTSTLFVEGLSGDGLMSMMDVRKLAGELLEYQRDGGQVVLT